MSHSRSDLDAAFSPKLKVYFFLNGALTLCVTIVGILLLPLWPVAGYWWAGRSYAALKCQVNNRSVVIKKGVLFRQELTIPLDKIQDISLHEGPILSMLGLLRLRIETAGQSSSMTGQSNADLIGLINARGVRDEILERRDLQAGINAAPPAEGSTALLAEIRDTLLRIEKRLQ